jgi:hypothetical protein
VDAASEVAGEWWQHNGVCGWVVPARAVQVFKLKLLINARAGKMQHHSGDELLLGIVGVIVVAASKKAHSKGKEQQKKVLFHVFVYLSVIECTI